MQITKLSERWQNRQKERGMLYLMKKSIKLKKGKKYSLNENFQGVCLCVQSTLYIT